MQRIQVLLSRPFRVGLALCLISVAPACGGGNEPADTEEEEEEDDESNDTSSKSTSGSTDGETSSSSTGGSSSDSSNTSTKDTTSDTSTSDPGAQLGKCDRALMPTKTVSGDIKASETWSGVVKISGDIELRDGATLTIEKGTTILADAKASLLIGDTLEETTINAVGTKDAPIRFCGSTDSAGFWKGIEFGRDTQAASVLAYVSIENAGIAQAAALNMEAPVRLDNVEISGCTGHGLWAKDFAAQSQNLRIEKCQVAARLEDAAAVQNFPKGSVIKDNLTNVVELNFDTIERTLVFHDYGAPYRQLRDMRLRDGAKVTMEAGVEYEFAGGRDFEVGGYSGGAELICKGTEKDKVVFRGQESKAGAWRGIHVREGSNATTTLTHTVIRHGGYSSDPSLRIERAIKLEHVSIEDALNGVYVRNEPLAADSTHLSAKNVKGYALRVEPEAILGLPAEGTFENNERSKVWVESGRIEKTGTIVKMPVPYHVTGTLSMGRGVDLVVAAGVEFEMDERAKMDFNSFDSSSSLIMKGTDTEKIKIFGAQKKQGYWGSVRLDKELKNTSLIEYVEFSDGGSGFRSGMLELDRAFPVTQCVFSNSEGYGIVRDRDDSTDYTQKNEFNNNKEGEVGN